MMRQAIDLARSGLGRVAPNPSVGCIVARDGTVFGKARTADGGRPHAETQALTQAGDRARGATVYVTLEPCNTRGHTPPCIDGIITAGVGRIVIAALDPYQVDKGGIDRLRAAGIAVDVGICNDEAKAINEGFFLTVDAVRPLVTAKVASSLDGCIATSSGESRWITGEAARQRGHRLRAEHDAVLAGIGTILADDPLLTVRLPEHDGWQPVRIILDPSLKTPMDSQIVRSAAQNPVWILCSADADLDKRQHMESQALIIIPLSLENGLLSPPDILRRLAQKGITRLMIEGGGKTITSFLRSRLVDRLAWFRAPILIGEDGLKAIRTLDIAGLNDAQALMLESREILDKDFLEIWRCRS